MWRMRSPSPARTPHPVEVGAAGGDVRLSAFGTMAALWHARATGEGQYVDVAMTDSILAMSELVVSQYSYRGVSPVPVGNGIPASRRSAPSR